MVLCWKKFGHGELDAFFVPRNWWEKYESWFYNTEVVGCKTCAEITFELPERREFTGLKDYMKNTKLDTKTTIYEYIAESDRFCNEKYLGGENCWEEFAKDKKIDTNLIFDSSEAYAVVFVREGIKKQEGTLNTYVMSLDTKNRVCKKPLPFR